jgi:phosphate-selective porin OprO and OprP
VNRRDLPDAVFNAYYGQLAWSFTGDHRDYSPPAGSYLRIYPNHPFDLAAREWGAWEIAVRWDYVNLDSHFTPGVSLSDDPAAVNGGIQRDFTFGLNWYPNAFIRFMLNYIHVDFDQANGTSVPGAPLGVPVGARIDALALRSQFEF